MQGLVDRRPSVLYVFSVRTSFCAGVSASTLRLRCLGTPPFAAPRSAARLMCYEETRRRASVTNHNRAQEHPRWRRCTLGKLWWPCGQTVWWAVGRALVTALSSNFEFAEEAQQLARGLSRPSRSASAERGEDRARSSTDVVCSTWPLLLFCGAVVVAALL